MIHTKVLADKYHPFPETSIETFRLEVHTDLRASSFGLKSGCSLVDVTREGQMLSLTRALEEAGSSEDREIVVASVKPIAVSDADVQQHPELVFDTQSARVFSQVVAAAEKIGRPVNLLALRGEDHTATLLNAALQLKAESVWLDASTGTLDAQSAELLTSWNALPNHTGDLKIMIVGDMDGDVVELKLS